MPSGRHPTSAAVDEQHVTRETLSSARSLLRALKAKKEAEASETASAASAAAGSVAASSSSVSSSTSSPVSTPARAPAATSSSSSSTPFFSYSAPVAAPAVTSSPSIAATAAPTSSSSSSTSRRQERQKERIRPSHPSNGPQHQVLLQAPKVSTPDPAQMPRQALDQRQPGLTRRIFVFIVYRVVFLHWQGTLVIGLVLAVAAIATFVSAHPCVSLGIMAGVLPIGAGMASTSYSLLCDVAGLKGKNKAGATMNATQYQQATSPFALVDTNFPSFSLGISSTADAVTNVITNDPSHGVLTTASDMPAKDALGKVDAALQKHFRQRLPREQRWYADMASRIRKAPSAKAMRQGAGWMWWRGPAIQARAVASAMARARAILEVVEEALRARHEVVRILTISETLKAAAHALRNTCAWKQLLEQKPYIAERFVKDHYSIDMDGDAANLDSSNTAVIKKELELALAEVSRARVLCRGSHVMTEAWDQLQERITRREMEDLLTTKSKLEDLLATGPVGGPLAGNGVGAADEIDDWEGRLYEVTIKLLDSIQLVYGDY
ncbi:hypothetical protein CCUS01_15309 [Colletotrichum cuscutae]|uniref:Transmembrane protein n=1 Tax=Colletotrichum cuscutae TaxID=1209917 RepID=A0AAI9Y5V9_9PEZI|nr:hypothetical protein CCUS01_15309 [Colletotrichum cuscutae]